MIATKTITKALKREHARQRAEGYTTIRWGKLAAVVRLEVVESLKPKRKKASVTPLRSIA